MLKIHWEGKAEAVRGTGGLLQWAEQETMTLSLDSDIDNDQAAALGCVKWLDSKHISMAESTVLSKILDIEYAEEEPSMIPRILV